MSLMRPRTDRPSLSVVEVCRLPGHASQPWSTRSDYLASAPVAGYLSPKPYGGRRPHPRQRSRLTVLAVSPTGGPPSVAVYVKGMSYEQEGPSSVAVG